ncbi:glycoside hydrolase family 127 protein [Undibacterium sp. LX40W]|uniref:Glycoside hydrolase family 127 protein n=1 Tax=Undibacterium nitidum TaxID=2762298 RepID=A0A923KNM7_9BURK|nr:MULTISPECIES: glycoside hydrolase family 127 protein [Undibacterium]MBC3880848.1 glycoside hydrolase family 127 protein [Undibacterium nitidum]MBC3890419.1 glycoside hydrolase family 127 protein [Undibacterium sp. LX40W]
MQKHKQERNQQRRRLLKGLVSSAGMASSFLAHANASSLQRSSAPTAAANPNIQAIAMERVRLLPSVYLDALRSNQAYLLRLQADRMLHNYYRFAGLSSKGKPYGGWEADTIAGEALGHYLSALSLMYAQTGVSEMRHRANYIVNELERVQEAHGDGYVGGFLRKRKSGEIVDGKEIFAEIMAGDIRSAGFDLNGCWVPFYNWHKVLAGLFDAQRYCKNQKALKIAEKLANYIAKVFDSLNETQLQQVLNCEHGGINESFAELYVRTNNSKWLTLAERLYHSKTLEPLVQGRDNLASLHANTQIPKVIGLARLAEITGKARYQKAGLQFWNSVVEHHSYVIGGHGDREYFDAPDTQHQHISEQTCEACGTYNMLKLTRHLYSWKADPRYFDFYERGHLNHILTHQNPKTGMFTYMTPLMSGVAREFSNEEDSFWCCVLSGLESHAKHGDSIYWSQGNTLLINLYIPSRLHWREQGLNLKLTGAYPFEEEIQIEIENCRQEVREIALRIPAWATEFSIELNGKVINTKNEDGYCRIKRSWKQHDRIRLKFPMALRLENAGGKPAKDDDQIVAVLRGPMVLGADLGAADKPYSAPSPALVGHQLLSQFKRLPEHKLRYQTLGIGKPTDMQFMPFFQMAERRAAVYFPRFTESQWQVAAEKYQQEEEEKQEIARRSVDIMYLGEMQAERDHQLESDISYPVSYRGRNGRDARTGGFFAFDMKVKPGTLSLQASYWGEERNRRFSILVDEQEIARVELDAADPGVFVDKTYAIPPHLTAGKNKIRIRFQPETGFTAGPVFGCRLILNADQ